MKDRIGFVRLHLNLADIYRTLIQVEHLEPLKSEVYSRFTV